jgi:hypothetical protein
MLVSKVSVAGKDFHSIKTKEKLHQGSFSTVTFWWLWQIEIEVNFYKIIANFFIEFF